MAQPALESFTKRGLAMKAEAVEGTDIVPTAGADGILLFEGTSGTEFDRVERNVDRPFFTGQPFGVANKRAFIEGDFELFSPATPGQVATGNAVNEVLLLSGGMTVVKSAGGKTTTYNPISGGIISASAYFWHVDQLLKVLGARTAISGLAMQIGERFKGRARVQGDYSAITAAALPAITTYTSIPTISTAANSTSKLSVIGGVSNLPLWSKILSVDLGTQLATKEYTAKKVNQISGRQPTFTLRFARTDLGDFNPVAIRDAGSIITASYTLNETAVLSSTLNIRGQIETVQKVEIDGDLGYELSGPLVASSAGGDEFSVVFADSTP